MKGTISNMLMGGLIASILMVAGIFAYNNLFTSYNPTAIQNDTAFNKINDFSANAESLQNQLQGSGTNTLVAAEVILTGGWSAMLLLLNTPTLLFDLFTSSASATGWTWPEWIFVGGLAVITLYFVLRITGIATKSESEGL